MRFMSRRAGPGPKTPISAHREIAPIWSRHGRELFYVEGQRASYAVDLGGAYWERRSVLDFQGGCSISAFSRKSLRPGSDRRLPAGSHQVFTDSGRVTRHSERGRTASEPIHGRIARRVRS